MEDILNNETRTEVIKHLEYLGLEVLETKHRNGKIYSTKKFIIDREKGIKQELADIVADTEQSDIVFLNSVHTFESRLEAFQGDMHHVKCINKDSAPDKSNEICIYMDLQ